MVLLAYVGIFAGDLFVETLDEQQSSKNLLVLPFRINNEIGPIQNAVLKYCLQKDSRKPIAIENYYVEDARVTLLEVDSTNACVEIAMAYIPEGVFPNQSGYRYSKGKVWLGNSASSGTIRYFGAPEHIYTTQMQEGASGRREVNEDARLWPFAIPEISPKENFSRDEIIVKSGEEFTLFGTKSLHSLKVEAGGKLYLGEGEFVVDNLQLDSKSEITFINPGYKTILHVNNRISWNGDAQSDALGSTIASGFKLYYYGTETFFVYGLWRGTIIAPNAMVVLGQNQRKVLYGQFLAKQLTVHQYSTIWFIPFNPKESEQIALRNNL